ncbi:MAG: hypothetical protein AAF802_27390 [Planctomycetota bacterium]
MSTDTSSTETETVAHPRSLGAVMSSEAGFEPGVDDSPLRISGFLSVILGLVGGFTIVALPMVAFSVAGFLVGMFALRKSDSQSLPVGTTAARLGVCLSLLLGSWGVARYGFLQHDQSSQAEHFAKEFVKVAALGNSIYASELRKSHVNRFLRTMPLEESYEQARLEAERKAAESPDGMGPEEREEESVQELVKYGPEHEWILDRPVNVYYHYGRQMAEVILAADRSEKPYRLRIILEYLINRDDGAAEWYVETVQRYRERIVAESIL